ncbi:MAG: SsrA-binding protein SmpB [Candidatus Paceibacterota bacterium]|jgi:SsrA-binding protein
MGLITNKKAYFNYEITDKYSAGVELFGFEVKSLRNGHGSLEGAYVTVRGKEAFLINAFIPPYQENNTSDSYNPRRNRKLLLTKKEIEKLGSIEKTKNLTVLPISVYNKGRVLKIDLGIGKGKKKHNKRQVIKERETDREIEREFKAR